MMGNYKKALLTYIRNICYNALRKGDITSCVHIRLAYMLSTVNIVFT